MGREGKLFDGKERCGLSCVPIGEQKWVVLFFFTSSTLTVYSSVQASFCQQCKKIVYKVFFKLDARKELDKSYNNLRFINTFLTLQNHPKNRTSIAPMSL